MKLLTVVTTFLAVASTAGLGGYWLGQPRPSSTSDKPSSTEILRAPEPSEESAKQAEAIQRLEKRLAAMELRQLYAKPREDQSSDKASQPERLDFATIREREMERSAAIEAAMRTQARDTAWAPVAESQLQTAVDGANKEGGQFSVKTLRCLTSVCEMVLSASNPDHLRHTMFELDPRITGMKSFDVAPVEIAADGSATLTYRLFRNGYSRPDEDT